MNGSRCQPKAHAPKPVLRESYVCWDASSRVSLRLNLCRPAADFQGTQVPDSSFTSLLPTSIKRSTPAGSQAAVPVPANAVPRFGAPDHLEIRSEEHTSELQSHSDLVCRLLLEK